MKKLIRSFFYRRDDFQPPYFWITALMSICIIMLILRLAGFRHVDNTLVLGVLGFVASWVAVYNWDRKNNQKG